MTTYKCIEKNSIMGMPPQWILPLGYKFLPQDEELLLHYLRPKVFGTRMPADIIPEIHSQICDPMQLQDVAFDGGCGELYIFTKNHQGMTSPEQRSNGDWEDTGINEAFYDEKGILIGTKRAFSYKLNNNDNTWTMYEYHLSLPLMAQRQQQPCVMDRSNQSSTVDFAGPQARDKWVLVKIENQQKKQRFEQAVNPDYSVDAEMVSDLDDSDAESD